MTKKDFIKRIIISSILTVIAIALIITFLVFLFIKYTKPNEDNTSVKSGIVTDVNRGGKNEGIIVEISNGERLQLVYPSFSSELFSKIGYDFKELCELLEGESIEYRRMDRLPWITEIYAKDIQINNNELTNKQITLSHIGIVIIGIMMLAIPVSADVEYMKKQYSLYKKAEKKRIRKARQSLKKSV